MPDTEPLLRHLAERAAERGLLVAGRLAALGIPLDDLPAILDCTPICAWHATIYQRPRAPDEFDPWTTAIATWFALDQVEGRSLGERLIETTSETACFSLRSPAGALGAPAECPPPRIVPRPQTFQRTPCEVRSIPSLLQIAVRVTPRGRLPSGRIWSGWR